ncbi:MAG: LysR substrate-binding domain-containing protein [Rhodospirillales bacterium]
MRLNMRQIEAFRAVYQTGGMTSAGQMMNITQPAVSRLIRDLEAEIGLALFVREGTTIAPTPDAASLYEEVERSFHGLDQVALFARDLKRNRSGRINITASLAPSFFALPTAIASFRHDWPDITVSLRSCSSPEVMELVAAGKSDLGLAVMPAQTRGVEILPLPGLAVVAVLPTAHPLAKKKVIRPTDLAGEPMLMVSEYSPMQQRILKSFEAAGVSPNIIFDSSYSGSICALVAKGLGISVLDPVTARAYEGPGLALRRFEPRVPYELRLVRAANRPVGAHVRAFAEALVAALQGN